MWSRFAFRDAHAICALAGLAVLGVLSSVSSCGGSAFHQESGAGGATSDPGGSGRDDNGVGGDDHGTGGSESGGSAGAAGRRALRDAGLDRAVEGTGGAADDASREDVSSSDAPSEGEDSSLPHEAGSDGSRGSASGECTLGTQCDKGPCAELTPGGYTVCLTTPEEATVCGGVVDDECCASKPCSKGTCYANPVTPSCTGTAQLNRNVCASDECTSDADCKPSSQICLPAGALGRKVRACLDAYCRTNADCSSGSECAPVTRACCSQPNALACVPSGGCKSSSDCCKDGSCTTCEVDLSTKKSACQSTPATCTQ